jgi:NAD(P)-dependent dehydrogenase (short-subunit alcohol dehydrogenase family)
VVNSLNGKRVLITGAANGIGYATATMFADAGARVIGLDLDNAHTSL